MVFTVPFSLISQRFSIPPWRQGYGYEDPLTTPRFSPVSLRPHCNLAASLATASISSCSRVRHHLISATAGGIATDSMLQDVVATAAVLGGAYALVFFFENLTKRDLIPQRLSRKLVHIFSGLLFALSWPIFRYFFFPTLILCMLHCQIFPRSFPLTTSAFDRFNLKSSASTEARYFAAVVPLVNCLRLLVNGLSVMPDASLIQSVTREGKAEELLKGPLYYVLVLIVSVLVFWRDSPTGIITLAMLCGGDGIADIMGRKFGSQKIPYNLRKSWAGSISMFIFGFAISIGVLYYYSSLGYLKLNWETTPQRVALVSLVATVVESLPITDQLDDNLSVPMASIVAAYLIFGY